mgnify:CR=1 FL=1
MTGSCSIHILKAERRCQYEIRSKSSPVSCGSPECISGTDAEMDAEPVGVCAGTAHAVYFRLRPLYTVLPGVDAVFDLAGGGVWLLPAPHRRNGHCRSRGMVQRLDCRIIKFLCRHCAAFSFCREVVKLAATRLIALHKNKGKSVAACLKSRTDYAQNPDKTQQGELVSSYECSPLTVDEEFMLSKRQYELATGRRQKSDVIAYQIRQSFKPGEITAEEANKVGYELAMRFTKGKYAFIVATHTDREHIHNHIIYNSTALDSTRKFRDFLLSGLAVQRLSDLICLEHQLSVIEIKPYRERQKRTLYPLRESNRDKLCAVIDSILLSEKPVDFESFLQKLEQQGYEIKRGKHTSVKGTRQKRFIRFRTLGAGYSEDEIKAVIAGEAEHRPHQKQPPKEQPFHLLVDIQAKLSEGKSEGYARWAKRYNLKEMSKTLIFLQENKIGSIEEMQERVDAATAHYHELGDSIKVSEKRLAEIAVLKAHIINYAKTRPIYDAYRKTGYSKRFLEAHHTEITLHKAAKAAFDESNLKTLPKVKELDAEYSKLLTEKKAAYPDYRKAKEEMQELLRARRNVELFFAEEKDSTEKTKSR